MSSSTTSELVRSLTIYGGLSIFISGIIGNLLNLCCLWSTHHNPCAFLFICSSMINCVVLIYGLLTRILSVGFNLDWSTTNLIWCQTRAPLTQATFFMSLTCVCLASIDRCLISCRKEKYRNLSRLSLARWSVLFTILFWLCHSIPEMIYSDIILINPLTNTKICLILSPPLHANYRIYISLPIWFGLFPSLILTITGLITYRNTTQLQLIHQREIIQKQLTTMMIIQIPIILISTTPYVIFTEYSVFSATMNKTSQQRIIESIIFNILTLIFYLSFACSFFVFFLSSKSFRQQIKRFILCHKSQMMTIGRTIQVQPYSTTRVMRNTIV